MKKFFLLCTILFLAIAGFAQTIIPKAGVTLSTIAVEEDNDALKSKLGFTLGLGFNMPLGEGPLSFQPELNFVQKGFKIEGEDGGFSIEENYTLNYLEVPVLVRASFGDATKFFVNAGPSVAFGLGGKMKGEVSGGGMSEDYDAKIKFGDGDDEEVFYVENGVDIGLQIGAGVLVANKVSIEFRYGLGMTSLYDSENDDDTEKNRVFQFTIGIPLSH